MASPYALDFNPLTQAIQNNQQLGLQQNRLAQEQQRLDWEGQIQPFRVQQAKQAVDTGIDEAAKRKAAAVSGFIDTHVLDPNVTPEERNARWNKVINGPLAGMSHLNDPEIGPLMRDPNLGPQMVKSIAGVDPLQRRLLQAQVTGAEDTLAATRALRSDLGGGDAATPQISRVPIPTQSYGTAPSQPYGVTPNNTAPTGDQRQTGVTTPFPGMAVTTPIGTAAAQQLPQSGDAGASLTEIQAMAPRVAGITPDQTAIDANGRPLFNLPREIQGAQRMIASLVPAYVTAGETKLKFLQSMMEKGMMPTTAGGVMEIPGSAKVAAERKGLEETATGNAKYYDTLHKGLVGSAMIAAQQKQNIDLIKQVIADPGFGMGTASSLQQGTVRALATLGLAPEAAAKREVFNQTMARILADQFSGLKSIASTTGETGARIFKPMLDIEEKAISSADDSIEGIRRKIAILDKAGDLMMQWGDMADAYAHRYGRLDPQFDTALRGKIAEARIPNFGLEPEQKGGAPAQQSNQAQESGGSVTKEKLLAMPDGPVDLGGQRFMKQGSQLFPLQGDLGSITNPYASKPQVTAPGQHAYENGRLYKRTPNYFSDRWEEAPWQWPVRAQ